MSISYGSPVHGKATYQSGALNNIKSLVESFEQDGVSVLTEGVSDVLQNRVSFAEYTEKLLEGVCEAEKPAMTQLIENTRLQMLSESMMSGSNPITALSLPMLRIGWPKIAVREGLPTEPVEQPKFKVTTHRQYIRMPNGVKRFLPEALVGAGAVEFGLPKLTTNAIAATAGAITAHDLLAEVGKNTELGDEVDARFSVVEVSVVFDTATEVHTVNFELDTNINVVQGSVTSTADASKTAVIMAKVNRETGILDAVAIGGELKSIKIVGFITSEANNSATQVGFDIQAIECVIGTAQPIEAPINIQHMTDLMHMYQIDATLSNIEIMSTTLAHLTDLEGVNFIDSTYQRDAVQKINETFDVKPPANYLLGDTAWREEVKLKLDRLVTRLQTSANIYSGHAVVFCHPLDAQIISNVKWAYSASEQVNDVAVDYKVGNYVSGITSYMVLQSNYFTQGKMRIVYVPADSQHKSLVYYPYSFSTIRGSASSSPNAVNVPAIQMIKRHLFKAFTPLVAMLNISNNGV